MQFTDNKERRATLIDAAHFMEGKLFYAYKNLEELELKYEGVLPSKLDSDQIAASIKSAQRQLKKLQYLDRLVEKELDYLNRNNMTTII